MSGESEGQQTTPRTALAPYLNRGSIKLFATFIRANEARSNQKLGHPVMLLYDLVAEDGKYLADYAWVDKGLTPQLVGGIAPKTPIWLFATVGRYYRWQLGAEDYCLIRPRSFHILDSYELNLYNHFLALGGVK